MPHSIIPYAAVRKSVSRRKKSVKDNAYRICPLSVDVIVAQLSDIIFRNPGAPEIICVNFGMDIFIPCNRRVFPGRHAEKKPFGRAAHILVRGKADLPFVRICRRGKIKPPVPAALNFGNDAVSARRKVGVDTKFAPAPADLFGIYIHRRIARGRKHKARPHIFRRNNG